MDPLLRLARVLSLVFFAVLGSSVLMYSAPGYFSNANEMDAAHSASARKELNALRSSEASLPLLLRRQLRSWSRGDLGQSRQFGVPVLLLVRERCLRSARLLGAALLLGWAAAFLVAVPNSMSTSRWVSVPLTLLSAVALAIPVGALATVCLIANTGGPVLVLASLIAVRDFKLLQRLLQQVWREPYVVHAVVQGLSPWKIVLSYIVPAVRREVLSILVLSFVLALSALVPVEVVFDYAGLGQLAWSAAMNRDLPVLIGVTALMAACIGAAGSFAAPGRVLSEAPCA